MTQNEKPPLKLWVYANDKGELQATSLPISFNDKTIVYEMIEHSAYLAIQQELKEARKVISFYANENSYYLQKDPVTGSEVRRSIVYEDTESFGYQKDPYSPNILQVSGGKLAREYLAKYPRGECVKNKYTDDLGNEITCSNCDVTAREWFNYVLKESPIESWFAGNTWYCSDECYDEATKDEG